MERNINAIRFHSVTVCAVGHVSDSRAHRTFAAEKQLIGKALQIFQVIIVHHGQEPDRHKSASAGLSPDVAHSLVRSTHIRADHAD